MDGLRIHRHAYTSAAHEQALAEQLAHLLIDVVAHDGSVGFMHPLPEAQAISFWQGVLASVSRNERCLLLAHDAAGGLIGTVQLITAMPPNQPHRADVAKMMVHSSARRQGVGEALLRAVQAQASALHKRVLVLDTVKEQAAWHMYQRLGWHVAGDVPQFAYTPHGQMVATTFMYKILDEEHATNK